MTLTKRTTPGIISLSNRMVNRAFCLCLPGNSQQKLWAKRPSRVMLFSALPFGLTAWQTTRWGRFAMKIYKAYKPPKRKCEWDNSPRICPNCQSEFIPKQSNQIYCCTQCYWAYYEKESHRMGRFLILERDEFRCIYCGMSSVEDATQLHVDHIIPRISDGEDTAGNLVTACTRCNLEKSCRMMEEKNIARVLAEVERRNLDRGIEPQLTIKLSGTGTTPRK